ncbi:DNA polymerase III subunit delta [Candidatus Pelagibacter sp.]|nr:DNA polymerase III subunit delta [Candidatus Pelagibacter sp.]
MIIKNFELEKIKKSNLFLYLLYGQNEGLKKHVIENCFIKNFKGLIEKYDEKEVIENQDEIHSKIFNKSFFENEKIILISRTSDKIVNFIEKILEKNVSDIKIIFLSEILEKKSKLRNLFEKNSNLICIPFYADDNKILTQLCGDFFKKKNIPISREILNTIVDKCQGDRNNLNQELEKVEMFIDGNTNIEVSDILKLINLSENYSVSELVDSCLSKNIKNTAKILNENSYTNDDCMLILRTMLNKTKRLIKLRDDYDETKNLDSTVSNFRPLIFWKDKDIIKKQILKWDKKNSSELIFEINELEKIIKKNSENSLRITYDFVLSTAN